MTLFISFLLIYNFNMDWWWYGIATVLWVGHFGFTQRKRFASSIAGKSGVRPREFADADSEKPA
jgi:hypothetical protein